SCPSEKVRFAARFSGEGKEVEWENGNSGQGYLPPVVVANLKGTVVEVEQGTFGQAGEGPGNVVEVGNSTRKQCNYSMCSSPIRVVAATLRWTTNGSDFRQIGPEQNPALVATEVPGADAAFYLEQGNRLTVYRGNISLLINTGGTQAEAIALAEAALAEM
ncbi:MAG: hypothetical protein AAF840_12870, partial [Bacteroidota bacterium]